VNNSSVDLFVKELMNLDKIRGAPPTILNCLGIYKIEFMVYNKLETKIAMIFPAAESSLQKIFLDKSSNMSDKEIINMLE
jgi:hypothetical protein